MMKLFFCVVVILSYTLQSASQHYPVAKNYDDPAILFEFGAGAGLMNCATDLGGRKKGKSGLWQGLTWKNSNAAMGTYFSAIYKNTVALRIEFDFGGVQASDSILEPIKSHTAGRYERNLHFKSHVNEVQVVAEIYPFQLIKSTYYHALFPYLFLGFGFFSFEPKAELYGQWYSLGALHTEGQSFVQYPSRRVYKPGQFNISTGLGLKYDLGPSIHARVEFNYRFLQTDYLDDVSTGYIDPSLFDIYLPVNQARIARDLYNRRKPPGQDTPLTDDQRGNPKRNDAYYTIMLKIGVRLPQHNR